MAQNWQNVKFLAPVYALLRPGTPIKKIPSQLKLWRTPLTKQYAFGTLNIVVFTKIFARLCARPEPVEGFLRALKDILQQVQDERGEDLEYNRDKAPQPEKDPYVQKNIRSYLNSSLFMQYVCPSK